MASKVQRLLLSAISRSEFPNVVASRRLIATTAQNQKPPPNFEDKATGEVPTHFLGFPPHTRQIGLPASRVLYTVLRSPHIDKKSREQFQMKIKKKLLVIEADRHELRNKFFWLKRQRIFGAQYEILISCKTRLDKGKLQSLL